MKRVIDHDEYPNRVLGEPSTLNNSAVGLEMLPQGNRIDLGVHLRCIASLGQELDEPFGSGGMGHFTDEEIRYLGQNCC